MKKLLIVLLCLLMLLPAGCKKKPEPVPGGDPEPAESDVQKQFNELQLKWFAEDLSEDYSNLHFSLVDPAKYGIKDVEVTLGEIHYDLTDEDRQTIADLRNRNLELAKFKPEELTEDQQIMYECMKYYFNLQLALMETEKDYTFLFTPNSGLNNNVITVFTEFDFRSEQDVKDYITLLNDTGRYFDQAIEYTRRQAEEGIIQPDSTIDGVLEQCERFIADPDKNEVVKVFVGAMDGMNLAGQDEYIAQVRKGVDEVMIPAYKRVIEFYEGLKGKATKSGALADYGDDGKKLYELIVRNKVSSDKSIEEIMDEVQDKLVSTFNSILRNLDTTLTEGYGYNDPYEILDHIKEVMTDDYPEIPKVDYKISFLDKSVTSENTSAYYLIAPADDYNKNVIKVNPTFVENDPDGICITLAHEGYPGHLFQNTYYLYNHPGNEYRYNMSFLGYAEGWAEYCENRAYNYFLTNSREIKYLQDNNMFNYLLYAMVDMGVHYENWTVRDVATVLEQFFQKSYARSVADQIFETVVGDPGLFLPYGCGMFYMTRMMEEAKSALGSKFDLKAYNKVVLDTGEAPFPVLQKQVDKYVSANK